MAGGCRGFDRGDGFGMMFRPSDPSAHMRGHRYRLLLAMAGGVVFWERVWPRLWPAVCVIGAFIAVALMDILPRLPDWLHAAVLALFLGSLIGALIWARPAMRKVERGAARARLERDSELDGRPLQTLEDRLAAGREDLLAEALWHRHRQRMASAIGRLRLRLPRAEIARHEPWGVRAGVLLLLAVGLVAGYDDACPRLLRAVDPGLSATDQPVGVEVWITPPAYTGASPLFLTTAKPPADQASAEPLRIPHGSALLARVAGVRGEPSLAVGSAQTAFASLGGNEGRHAWRAEATITGGDRITVRAGRRVLAAWPLQLVADDPPRATIAKPPAPDGNGLLGLSYQAEDDYGVAEIVAIVEGVEQETQQGAPLRLPLPLATPGAKSVSGRTLQDLAAHRLAGRPTRMQLEAKDGAGQIGRSETTEVVLPERLFSHPVARRVAGLRKRLFTPDVTALSEIADELEVIAGRPEEYADDTVMTLTLAVAKSRLRLDGSARAITSVQDLLWQTALRIEQGDVPFAERQLEEARQRLADALQQNAPQAEIERLMDELQQALERYLAAAVSELARRGQLMAPLDPKTSLLRPGDLNDLLETARQLARSGGREGAMQMLAQLQRLLDGIRSGLRSADVSPEMAEAQAMMQALRELNDRQQQLLDDSFQRLRERNGGQERPGSRLGQRSQGNGQRPSMPPSLPAPGAKSDGKGAAPEQQALRQDLGELMLRMGDFIGSIPAPLGAADQAMRGAADALGQGRLGDAVPNQERAVDALQQALQSAGQALAQRLGGIMGFSVGVGENGDGSGDIFGRAPDGHRGFATGTLKIPDRGTLQRAQEILSELRRRAAERSRPREELDYIDRLLRQF